MATKFVSKGITRFDLEDKHVHGYMVRICRRGEHVNEFKSDAACGGKRKALAAAKERYQELAEQMGPPMTSKDRMTARNSTGKVGVHIARSQDDRSPDSESFAYCAMWKAADGRRKKISFAWNKYGKKDAFQLACLARDHETSDRKHLQSLLDSGEGKKYAGKMTKKAAAKSTKKKATKKKAGAKKASRKKARK